MRNQTEEQGAGHTVTRILALSPDGSELVRRNNSRIFVSSGREVIIDAMLLQGSRSIESYIPAVGRAIAESGLQVKGDLQLKANFDSKFGSGVFQQHLITNGWLQDNDGEVFDLFVELEDISEGEFPNMETYDAEILEGHEFETPLVFKLGIEDLTPQWNSMYEPTNVSGPRHEPEVDEDRIPGARGRVKDPSTDRRLKENREHPEQMVTARKSQNQSGDSTERMAGMPGRVRFPELDGRLKRNRSMAVEGAGGR